MSRLKELWLLRRIENDEQEKEIEYYMEKLPKHILFLRKQQYELYQKLNVLVPKVESSLPNIYQNSDILQVQKRILKLDYLSETTYRISQKFKHLLNQQITVN